MLSRMKKIIMWIFGVIALLLLLAWVGIVLFFPDDKVLSLLLDELRNRTGWQVAAKSLDLEMFRGFVLSDVQIGPDGDSSGPALEIKRLELGYDPAELFHKHIIVKSASLDGVRLHMRWYDREWNIETMLAQLDDKMSGGPENGIVDHEQGIGWSMAIDMINVTNLSISTSGRDEVHLNVAGANLELSDIEFVDGKLKLHAGLSLPVAKDANVRLGTDGLRLDLGTDLAADFDSAHGLDIHGRIMARKFRLQAGTPAVDLDALLHAELDSDWSSLHISDLVVSSANEQIIHARGSITSNHGEYRLNASSDLTRITGSMKKLLGLTNLHGDIRLVDSHVDLPLENRGPYRMSTTLIGDGISFASGSMAIDGSAIHAHVSARAKSGCKFLLSLNGNMDMDDFSTGPVSVRRIHGKIQIKASVDDTVGGWGLSIHGSEMDISSESMKSGDIRTKNVHVQGNMEARCKVEGEQGVPSRLDCSKLDTVGTYDAARVYMKDKKLWNSRGSFKWTIENMQMSGNLFEVQHLVADTRFRAGGIRAGTFKAGASKIHVELDGRRFHRDRFRFPAGLEIGLDIDGASYADEQAVVSLDELSAHLSTRFRSNRDLDFPVSLKLRSSSVKITNQHNGESWIVGGPLSLDAEGMLGMATGKIHFDKVAIMAKDLMDVTLSGSVDLRHALVDCKFATGKHDLKSIRALVPEDIRSHIPRVWGKVRVVGSVTGKLAVPNDYRHLPFSVDLSILHEDLGFRIDELGIEASQVHGPIQIKAGPEYGNEIRSSLRMHSDKFRFARAQMLATGVDLNLAGSLDADTLSTDGSVRFEKLELPGGWPAALGDVGVSFSSQFVGFKDMRLNEFKVIAPTLGVTIAGQGKLLLKEGIKDWTDLRMAMETRTSFDSIRPVKFPGGLEMKGNAEVVLNVEALASGVVSAKGGLKMAGLDVDSPWFSMRDAKGMIPISQRLYAKPDFRLVGRGGSSGRSRSTRASAYRKALLPLKGAMRSFSVGKLRLGRLEFTDFSGDLSLDSGRVDLSDLNFRFLGGDVISQTSITLAPEQQRGMWLDAQMSGIDLARLGAFHGEGSSDLSGNMRMSLDWNHRDLSSSIHLTSIGRSTLLTLLSALDPEKASKGLQEFRGFLEKYDVVPKEAQLDIRHGLASMIIRLDMGALAKIAAGFIHGYRRGSFYLPSVQVGNILSKYLRF